jgi:hypothetical protein
VPIPLFVGAGSGTVVTTGTGTVSKTSCTAGNLLILHVYEDQTASENTRSNRVNVEALNGVDNADALYQSGLQTGSPQVGGYVIFMGRVMANGTCSWDITVGASGGDLSGRIYEFSGVSTGTQIANVGENVGGSAGGRYRSTANTTTSVVQGQVIPSGPKRLGLALVSMRGAVTIDAFTGTSGGTWVEPVAEYSHSTGNGATMQIQTVDINDQTTIQNGTATITSSSWGCFTLALIPENPNDLPPVAWFTA